MNAPKLRCVARATIFTDEIKEKVRLEYMPNLSRDDFESYWLARTRLTSRVAKDAITRNFRYLYDEDAPPYIAGRFNSTTFPAVYTAKTIEVALAERLHYVSGGHKFDYVVYSVTASGEVIDLRPMQAGGTLELSNDHLPCRKIADDVRHAFAGVAWSSVREDGSCCAFFRCDDLAAVAIEQEGSSYGRRVGKS